MKLFPNKAKAATVSFCERCGEVCNAACRADALRERARLQTIAYGWRQA